MANLKESLTKGITAINMKTSTFMEESKCKTYISTLENEIKDLKLLIGEKAYEQWNSNESKPEELEEIFGKIKTKYEEIDVQKEKIQQLAEEEKQVLGSVAAQPQEAADVVFCSQCGAQNASNYKFCCKCGVPLK